MRHTGTCSVYFEGDPGRTKLHPVSSIFASPHIFSQNLRKVDVRKQRKEEKKHHTGVEEQGVYPVLYLEKTNKSLNRSQRVTSSPTFSEKGSGIVSLSVTNLAEILIWSPRSSQILMVSSQASTEI